MTIDSVVWAQYINVTDRQPRHHNKMLSCALASDNKNYTVSRVLYAITLSNLN